MLIAQQTINIPMPLYLTGFNIILINEITGAVSRRAKSLFALPQCLFCLLALGDVAGNPAKVFHISLRVANYPAMDFHNALSSVTGGVYHFAAPLSLSQSGLDDFLLRRSNIRIFPVNFNRFADEFYPGSFDPFTLSLIDIDDFALQIGSGDPVFALVQKHRLKPQFLLRPLALGDVLDNK